jgi:hypothetical protein
MGRSPAAERPTPLLGEDQLVVARHAQIVAVPAVFDHQQMASTQECVAVDATRLAGGLTDRPGRLVAAV